MKKILSAVAVVLAFALSAAAAEYTVRTVPNVQLSSASRFVSNPDGILSAESVYRIDTMLLRLKEQRSAQVAVVVVESIGDADPRMFVHDLLNLWQVGEKGSDNGLMVLLAVKQGAVEIETGYGLEGDLPDAICKRVINNIMLPYFRKHDFDGGMVEGMGAISAILSGREVEGIAGSANDDRDALIGMGVAFGAFALFMALISVLASRMNRCPKCKKRALKRSGERIFLKDTALGKTYKVAYVCQKCGHIVWRNEHEDNGGGNGSRRGMMGPVIFGGGRGFGGFGGFGGGGWGGGRSGGGGAGGRF